MALTVYDIQYPTKEKIINITNNFNDKTLNVILSHIGIEFNLGQIQYIGILPLESGAESPSSTGYDITIIDVNDENNVIDMDKNETIALLSLVYQHSYSVPARDILTVRCDEEDLIVTEAYAARKANGNNFKMLYTRKGIFDSIIYYEK